MSLLETNTRRPFTATDFPEMTDEELVDRVRGGELAWFELLMRRYNQRLYRVTRSILRNEAEAEDVIQDAYVRAYTHLDQFEGRARFATWLTKIAVYEARARLKRGRRFTALEDSETGLMKIPPDQMPPAGPTDDPENAAASRQLGQVLDAAIGALPESLREVFVLREIEGLSTAETAECLELSEANVKVRLHRARQSLRGDIDRRLGDAARHLYPFAGERCDRIVKNVLARITSAPSDLPV